MPEKDGSDDKKSTKSVVNKKQKQLMNKEQLDLSNVAESFGGEIVGEPVELDEIAITGSLAAYYGGAALLGLGATYWANRKKINQGLSNTFANMFGGTTTADDIIWRDDPKTNKDNKTGDGIGNDLKGQTFDPSKENVKINNKDLVRPGSTANVGTNALTNVKAQEISTTKTKEQTRRLPKPFRLRMPKIPGTPHNVGRRVNPQ